MLLRILKRKTSLESPLDEFIKVEFSTDNGRPDLALSVYEVEKHETIRAYSEHYAGLRLRPDTRTNLDASDCGTGTVIVAPGRTGFRFADAAHREICLRLVADLHSLAERIYNQREQRAVRVTKTDVREYFVTRVQANDAEWLRLIPTLPEDWRKWHRALNDDQ